MNDLRLIDLARHNGYITAEDVRRASEEAERMTSNELRVSALDVLMSRGLLDEEQLIDLRRVDDSASLPTPPPGYRILSRLGGGGMGNVFLATDLNDDTQVAIKMLPTHLVDDDEYRARFQREIQALDATDHPHIIDFRGAGRHQNVPFLVMGHHPGPDLKRRLREHGAITLVEAWHLLLHMSEALHHCAQRGIIHRDVKPSNIILAPSRPGRREPFRAILIDFGLAKGAASDAVIGGPLTGTGIAVGTPHYMSPEAATGSKSIDPRLDIYSLGATIVHALQGKTLYSGRSSAVIMYQHAAAAPDLNPLTGLGIAPDFLSLLKDMLSKNPAHRLTDWDAVLGRISKIRPPAGSEEPASGLAARRRHRSRLVVRLILMSLALILLLAGLLLIFASDSERIVIVTPQTWTAVLDALDERGDSAVILDLSPGVYPINTPLQFGDRSVTLRGSGAILKATADIQSLLIWRPSDQHRRLLLADLRLHGGGLEQHGGVIQLRRIQIHEAITGLHIVDGQCHASDITIADVDHAIVVGADASLELNGSIIKARRTLLRGDGARLQLAGCRFVIEDSHDNDAAAVICRGGSLRWEDVHITARQRRTAVMLDALDWGEWRAVRIIGARTAVRAQQSRLGVIQDLRLEAKDVGLHWDGPPPEARAWRDLSIRAPRPVIGIDLP